MRGSRSKGRASRGTALCGDVAGLKKMSFVLCGVATAIGYVSDRIDVEADVMDRVWTGHAASGCRSALLRFARDLRPAVDLVVKLAEEYDRVAEAARANREVMDMALTLMLDEAMTLGLDDVVELGSIALLDAPRLAQIGARIWEVIVKAKEAIERTIRKGTSLGRQGTSRREVVTVGHPCTRNGYGGERAFEVCCVPDPNQLRNG